MTTLPRRMQVARPPAALMARVLERVRSGYSDVQTLASAVSSGVEPTRRALEQLQADGLVHREARGWMPSGPPDIAFGQRVAVARRDLGWSQGETGRRVAAMTGSLPSSAQSSISRLERGESNVSPAIREALERLLFTPDSPGEPSVSSGPEPVHGPAEGVRVGGPSDCGEVLSSGSVDVARESTGPDLRTIELVDLVLDQLGAPPMPRELRLGWVLGRYR